jgi:AcrR family transcriptional regulator
MKRPIGKSKPRRRRTQEERRRDTQDAILKAAIALLVDRGYARFSTIAVAQHAGVSRGARENYYRTKYDLIAAAWRAALVRAKDHARRLAHRDNASEPLDRFLRDSESFFLSRDYMAMLELSVAARTEPALSRIFHALYREHRGSHDDIWIEALVRAGYDRAGVKTFVGMTNYLLRGLALTSVWQKDRKALRAALHDWRRIAPLYLRRGDRPRMRKKAARPAKPAGRPRRR